MSYIRRTLWVAAATLLLALGGVTQAAATFSHAISLQGAPVSIGDFQLALDPNQTTADAMLYFHVTFLPNGHLPSEFYAFDQIDGLVGASCYVDCAVVGAIDPDSFTIQTLGPNPLARYSVTNPLYGALPGDSLDTQIEERNGQTYVTRFTLLVSEPATALLLASGILGLGWVGRSRRS